MTSDLKSCILAKLTLADTKLNFWASDGNGRHCVVCLVCQTTNALCESACLEADVAPGRLLLSACSPRKSGQSNTNCKRCNGRDTSNHSFHTCKFKDSVCHKCGQKGHITKSPLCRQGAKPQGNNQKSKGQSNAKARPAKSAQEEDEATANSVRVVNCSVVSQAKDGSVSSRGETEPKARRTKKKVKVTEETSLLEDA